MVTTDKYYLHKKASWGSSIILKTIRTRQFKNHWRIAYRQFKHLQSSLRCYFKKTCGRQRLRVGFSRATADARREVNEAYGVPTITILSQTSVKLKHFETNKNLKELP